MKKPIVISFLQEKGGAGKTTMSTNVACKIRAFGHKVLLVDGDPQGSARDWNAQNGGSIIPVIGLDRETLPIDLKAVSSGYDFIVIDGAPQISKLSAAAIRASDFVFIPVQPSPYDVWASADLVELIEARRIVADGSPKAAFIISRAIKNSILSRDVNEALNEYNLPVLNYGTTQLVIYPVKAANGFPVNNEEIHNLTNEILEFINAEK